MEQVKQIVAISDGQQNARASPNFTTRSMSQKRGIGDNELMPKRKLNDAPNSAPKRRKLRENVKSTTIPEMV